jgi:hypothetical protein
MEKEQKEHGSRWQAKKSWLTPKTAEFVNMMHDSLKQGEAGVRHFFSSLDHVQRAAHHDWGRCRVAGCDKIHEIWRKLF